MNKQQEPHTPPPFYCHTDPTDCNKYNTEEHVTLVPNDIIVHMANRFYCQMNVNRVCDTS